SVKNIGPDPSLAMGKEFTEGIWRAKALLRANASGCVWKTALAHAVLLSLLEIGLFYYWFGVANRHVIFLYEHYGAGPFDGPTLSRYRMAGLVASGAVLVFYGIANWFVARLAGVFYRRYTVPEWWRVWLLCLPPLAIALPWLMTTLNWPPMPLSIALTTTAIALGSLPLALAPGRLAAEDLGELMWQTLAGLGLAPSLLLLRAVELTERMPPGRAISIAIGSTLAGAGWSLAVAWLYSWRKGRRWRVGDLLISTLCLAYLLGPLAHYLFFTPPGYRYITVAANFFARNLVIQITCFLILTALGWLVVQIQKLRIKGGSQ
ncbi:MAG: hypothetical protein RML46_12215, partial [Anaerolineae bacterium]|nr:hypothetical protein [Anaerolineae bacterium]